MEPTNTPFRKENDLNQNLQEYVPAVNLSVSGCIHLLFS